MLDVDPQRAGPDWRARVGVVLQSSRVEPELTVRECLELYAGYYPAPRPVREVMELVGLKTKAEVRGGPEGDNLSLIVVRWGPETLTDEPTTTITETLGLGEFQTEIDRTLTLTDRKGVQRDLTDDEIERAIAEIQATIKRYKT